MTMQDYLDKWDRIIKKHIRLSRIDKNGKYRKSDKKKLPRKLKKKIKKLNPYAFENSDGWYSSYDRGIANTSWKGVIGCTPIKIQNIYKVVSIET